MRHRECPRFFHQNVPAIIFEAFLLWCFFNIRQDSGLVFLVNNYDLAPRSVIFGGGKVSGGETGDASHTHGLPGVDGVSWTAPVACRDLRLWGGRNGSCWNFPRFKRSLTTPCRTCILIKSRNLQGFSVIQGANAVFAGESKTNNISDSLAVRDGVLIRFHVSDVLGVYDQHLFFLEGASTRIQERPSKGRQ